MRRYVVLQARPDVSGNAVAVGASYYVLLGRVEANGGDQAIRELAGESIGTYVAVPERNWGEVEVAVEQRSIFRITRTTGTSVEAETETTGAPALSGGD